jgi:HK97 gp10 family phage protein
VIRFTVTKNDFAKIAESLRTDCADAVTETGLEIEDGAKRRSRVKTGTMRRGWRFLRENQGGRRSVSGVVGNPVPYAPYHEFGTAHMAAQPMLIPEVEIARPKFEQRVRRALQPRG